MTEIFLFAVAKNETGQTWLLHFAHRGFLVLKIAVLGHRGPVNMELDFLMLISTKTGADRQPGLVYCCSGW